jgi:hypothetical protein
MHLFESVWSAQTETTPRLAQVLRNTARVLIENPGMTFAEIPLLLWEDGVREKLMRRVASTQTKLFFQHYNRRDPRGREELIASTINKADAYLHEPLVARIVSQSQSTIDFRRIMGCSSATTLIMKRLEFGGQEFSKRPDMIGQSSGHSRCSVVPLGLDQSRGM